MTIAGTAEEDRWSLILQIQITREGEKTTQSPKTGITKAERLRVADHEIQGVRRGAGITGKKDHTDVDPARVARVRDLEGLGSTIVRMSPAVVTVDTGKVAEEKEMEIKTGTGIGTESHIDTVEVFPVRILLNEQIVHPHATNPPLFPNAPKDHSHLNRMLSKGRPMKTQRTPLRQQIRRNPIFQTQAG
jgi:hypothetical protein